jgi:DNA-binding XRE family transcriptional regulator
MAKDRRVRGAGERVSRASASTQDLSTGASGAPYSILCVSKGWHFRSKGVLRDLSATFSGIEGVVLFDQEPHSAPELPQRFQTVPKREVLQLVSATTGVPIDTLWIETEKYKPLLKICLLIFAYVRLGIDYTLMIDDDVFIFRDIPEVKKLAQGQETFFISESSDQEISSILEFISKIFNIKDPSRIRRNISDIKRANVGFCGLSLCTGQKISS